MSRNVRALNDVCPKSFYAHIGVVVTEASRQALSNYRVQACKLKVATSIYESTQESGNILPSVVLWEALYMAAGLSASMLDDFDAWDFASFYHGALSPALSFLLSKNTGVSLCIDDALQWLT